MVSKHLKKIFNFTNNQKYVIKTIRYYFFLHVSVDDFNDNILH